MPDEPARPDDSDATELDTTELQPADENAPILLQDRWWWSSTLSLVLGGVITVMQVQALQNGGVWLNWLVAAVGTAVAGSGLVRLLRAYAKARSQG